MAELAVRRRAHAPAEHIRHQLHAVTDAECWQAEREHGRVRPRCVAFGDTPRSAGEDDADWLAPGDLCNRRAERKNLGVDRQLTQATRNQLSELRAEVENNNRLMCHWRPKGKEQG